MSKVLAIIAEYNPFHNGHLYHLIKSKKLVNPDYVVCIISGNFVQRGNVAIVDKWSRAEMALNAGANLVIELPTIYSISSAENFAEGCVKILDSFNLDTILTFGSECGDISVIDTFANILYKEPPKYKSLLAHELQTGISFPKARENALLMYINDIRKYANTLSAPNNILGIEYLKAIKKYKSKILPITFKRFAVEHDSDTVVDGYASGTHIRNLLCENKSFHKYVPSYTYKILAREINSGRSVLDIAAFGKEIIYQLRKMTLKELNNLPDVNESLANSIANAVGTCNTYDELIKKISSKTYTTTRIQRIFLYALLGITKSDMQDSKRVKPYVRVLGLDDKGRQLLSELSVSNPKLSIITSVKKFYENPTNKALFNMLNKDILATNIYTLEYLNNSESNLDFTKKIVTFPNKNQILK